MADPWDVTGERPVSEWDVVGEAPAQPRAAGLATPRTGAAAIPGYTPPSAPKPKPEVTIREKVVGAVEAGIEMLAQLTGGSAGIVTGGLAGIGRAVGAGQFGTPEGAQAAQESAAAGGQAGATMVRQGLRMNPVTGPAVMALERAGGGLGPAMSPIGQEYTANIGGAMANLPPVVGVHGTLAGAAATPMGLGVRPSLELAAEQAPRGLGAPVRAITQALDRVMPDRPAEPAPGTKASAGAAGTDMATQRRERARSLPAPIELTKGDAERTYSQQRFEKETAKDPELGQPLRDRKMDQTEGVTKNFEAFIEQTGATETDPARVGRRVVDPIVEKAEKAKREISEAYSKAREAGETAELVPTDSLAKLLNDVDSSSTNAGVITTAQKELVRLGGATRDADGRLAPGRISLGDLEELRKTVGAGGRKDATNAEFARQIREAIDASTKDAGGELYKAARTLYQGYAKEFKEKGVIRDLIGLKKGTSDRRVAFEDVFDRAVLRGTMDDLKNVRETLVSAGEKGEQAWKDMRGTALEHIKKEVFSNDVRDERGNKVPSSAKFGKVVDKLDQDGKLEYLFGKKGAEQLRDLRDITADIYTAPPGAVNTSNTASVVLAAIDAMISGASGMPLPVMTALKYTRDKVRTARTNKRVREALGEPAEPKPGEPAFKQDGAAPPAPRETTSQAGAAPAAAARDPRLAEIDRLREGASPETIKVLDAQRQRIERQLRTEEVQRNRNAEAEKLETTAQATDDTDIRQALLRRARELRGDDMLPTGEARELRNLPTAPVDRPKGRLPVGEAKELPPASGRAPDIKPLPTGRTREATLEDFQEASKPEPIPVGEATELPASAGAAVQRIVVDAEREAAWRRVHSFGDLDAKAAQDVAIALDYDAAAVERLAQQHERSPRVFEREIQRIIEEGRARESQTEQAGRGGEGLEASTGAAGGRAGAGEGGARPDGAAAAGAQRPEPAVDRGQAQGLTPVADLFRDNKGMKRADMPVIPNDLKPEFLAELKRDGVSAERASVPANSLKATQRDYNLENIEFLRDQVLGGKFKDNPIVVSSDGRVVDGHHRWVVAAQHKQPIDVLRVDLPIEDLLRRAKAFQERKGVASRSAAEASAKRAAKPDGEAVQQAQQHLATLKDVPQQLRDGIVERYRLAEAAKPAYDTALRKAAAALGERAAEVILAPIKYPTRAVAKILADYKGDPTRIKDLVRGTIVVRSIGDADAAIAALEKNVGKLEGLRNSLIEGSPALTDDGYRDIKATVVVNGLPTEVQVNVPEMVAAKAEAHPLYERVEKILREADGQKRALTDAENREVTELRARQRAIYDSAWEAATRLRNASSETRVPLRDTDKSGNQRGAAPSQASAAPAARMTGTPSTSKNSAPAGKDSGSFTAAPNASILGDAPVGRQTIATTERGVEVPVRYRLVDVDQLLTSHDDNLKPDPRFPAELQPRDRSRQSSEAQITRIANNIKPELLAESPKASDGAPIVFGDSVVESGNARTIALRRAYGTGRAEAYRVWLAENASRFGLSRADVERLKRPVLVRERLGDIDRAEFARQANESAVSAMSETEQAKADAARLPDLEGLATSEDGQILQRDSAEFVRLFMQAISPNEQNQLMTSDGRLSQRGQARIRNAIFARAYDDASIIAMLTEATDGNVRNILAGLLRAAPDVARVRDLLQAGARGGVDFVPDLIDAVRRYGDAREQGMTVAQALAQGSLIGGEAPPRVAELMAKLEADARAPKRVADVVRGLAQQIDAGGDPRQSMLLSAGAATLGLGLGLTGIPKRESTEE